VERGQYCYATLTRHPYNPLKLLGELANEEIVPWVRVRERVVWADGRVPLVVSYNEELMRSAFHLLLANTLEVEREAQVAFVATHSYSLKGLVDCGHFEVVTQVVFEESGQG
jgi:hypothetical protein